MNLKTILFVLMMSLSMGLTAVVQAADYVAIQEDRPQKNIGPANSLRPSGLAITIEQIHIEAFQKGEAKLLQCVSNSKAKVSAAENNQILKVWQREILTPMTDTHINRLSAEFANFSVQGQRRADLLLKWLKWNDLMRSQAQFYSKKENKNLMISLNSFMAQIFTGRPFAGSENIYAVTQNLKLKLDAMIGLKKSELAQRILALALFEEALVVEMQNTHAVTRGQRAENEAIARPILFAIGGSATFIAAMLSAEPILAASIGLSEYLGLGVGVGQTIGTGAIAGTGVTGIDAVVEIAIPLWIDALQEAERRNIPLSCSLLKQAEISKAKELAQLVQAFNHGAQVGMFITGVTLITPKIFSFLGGSLLNYGRAEKVNYLVSSGKAFYKLAEWVDEGILILVAGAVGVGAISEAKEGLSSYEQSLSFNDLIIEIQTEIQNMRDTHQVAKVDELEDLLRLVRSTQIGFRGDALKHSINMMVCGYLIYHFAHGEFIEAWRGGVDQVIETLALGADDTPVGIKAAYTAAKKAAVVSGNSPDPISIKLGLLKAKLVAMKLGLLSPSLSQSYDSYINMDNRELEENIHEIQNRVNEILLKNQS